MTHKGLLLAWTIAVVSKVTIEPLGADQDLAKDLSKMLAEQKTHNQTSEWDTDMEYSNVGPLCCPFRKDSFAQGQQLLWTMSKHFDRRGYE